MRHFTVLSPIREPVTVILAALFIELKDRLIQDGIAAATIFFVNESKNHY